MRITPLYKIDLQADDRTPNQDLPCQDLPCQDLPLPGCMKLPVIWRM